MATVFGAYELLDLINVGGMAEVFRARTRDERFQKIVAIKRILPHRSRDPSFVKMFAEEARLVANLNHGNIVQVFDYGTIDDTHYLAMEFVEGYTLAAIDTYLKERKRPFPVSVATYIALNVAQGLGYAHDRCDARGRPLDIVHRDVSPQNILISLEGEVKLADFGIAKAKSRTTETTQGMIKGKWGYLTPEQIEGEPVDRRTDPVHLGCGVARAALRPAPFSRHEPSRHRSTTFSGRRFLDHLARSRGISEELERHGAAGARTRHRLALPARRGDERGPLKLLSQGGSDPDRARFTALADARAHRGEGGQSTDDVFDGGASPPDGARRGLTASDSESDFDEPPTTERPPLVFEPQLTALEPEVFEPPTTERPPHRSPVERTERRARGR